MKLTNQQIYSYAKAINDAFQDNTQYLPVKVNFFILKNKNTLLALAQDIENSRIEIIRNYGEINEDGSQFIVPEDKIDVANNELSDLFNIEQDVDIRVISIDAFPENISLTTSQMEALMFMIE